METKKKSANVFLLTHKCGNHYYKSVFRNGPTAVQFQANDLRSEMPGANVQTIPEIDQEFLNIRCRNFDTKTVAALLNQVDLKTSKFFLFTRHPASFFRSATTYHLRGGEKWATKNRYSYLNNQTLHEALNTTHHDDEKLIISMKHFGLAWNLIDRWIQNHRFLLSIGAELHVIKTEELFSTTDESYFDDFSKKLSHSSYAISADTLKLASPAFMDELPKHSTGEFKKSSFHGYGELAKRFYSENFAYAQHYFYGS